MNLPWSQLWPPELPHFAPANQRPTGFRCRPSWPGPSFDKRILCPLVPLPLISILILLITFISWDRYGDISVLKNHQWLPRVSIQNPLLNSKSLHDLRRSMFLVCLEPSTSWIQGFRQTQSEASVIIKVLVWQYCHSFCCKNEYQLLLPEKRSSGWLHLTRGMWLGMTKYKPPQKSMLWPSTVFITSPPQSPCAQSLSDHDTTHELQVL